MVCVLLSWEDGEGKGLTLDHLVGLAGYFDPKGQGLGSIVQKKGHVHSPSQASTNEEARGWTNWKGALSHPLQNQRTRQSVGGDNGECLDAESNDNLWCHVY